LNTNVRELTIIALVSLFSLELAWAYDADLFAMFLRRQQPSLGSRRFDNLCDPSSCVQVCTIAERLQPVDLLVSHGWTTCASEVCGARLSARKRGAKLWSVLLLRAAVAVTGEATLCVLQGH
jgi:hypothetical protein